VVSTDEMDTVNRQIRNTVGELKSGWGLSAGGLTLAMQGAGAVQMAPEPIQIIVQANVNNDMDIERLARKLARKIERRRT